VNYQKNTYNKTSESITEEAINNSSAKIFPIGSVLIAMYGATIGKSSILKVEASSNQACCAILPNESYSSEFIYYSLAFNKRGLISRGVGGAQPNISQGIIKSYKIPLPPLPEQKKIASILSTVDEAIQNVKAQIERTKELKKGLMQRLFSEGIGHTEFKESKLGRIPKEWEVVRFEEIALVIMGQSPKGESYNNNGNGIPLINGPTEFTERYPIKLQWTIEPTKICEEGDILLCVRGSSTGRINIANDKYCIGRGVGAIRAKQNNDQFFMEYLVKNVVVQILQLAVGSTFPNVDSKSLRSILVGIPKLGEQKKIGVILSSTEQKIDKLEKEREELTQLKKGLMQKLLTGEVRVKINE